MKSVLILLMHGANMKIVYNTFISHVRCLMSVISVRCEIIRINVDTVDILPSVWVSVSHVKLHNYYNGDVGRVWGRGEVCTGFWLGNLTERDHWGDPDVDGRIILRWIFRKWEGVVGTGWSWLRIGTGGGRLLVR